MSEIHICAIVTPAKGKEERVGELLRGLANYVKDNERDTYKYEVYQQTNGEGTYVFVVEEKYKNQAAVDAHMNSDYFKNLGATIQEESLLAAGLNIMTIKQIGGFGTR